MSTQSLINRIMSGSLVLQIAIGIVAGVALSLIAPEAAKGSMLLGNLFVQALKAVAPILVLVLAFVRLVRDFRSIISRSPKARLPNDSSESSIASSGKTGSWVGSCSTTSERKKRSPM